MMEYPKEGEYWFDQERRIHGPLKMVVEENVDYLMCDFSDNYWYLQGSAADRNPALVQRAEVTRVGPLINQDEIGEQKP